MAEVTVGLDYSCCDVSYGEGDARTASSEALCGNKREMCSDGDAAAAEKCKSVCRKFSRTFTGFQAKAKCNQNIHAAVQCGSVRCEI